jgi:orotate phosphoribosyltransferase
MSAATLPPYKADFLRAAINGGVLKFGSFELKSKRISPYFFNAGEFYRADLLGALSPAYAKTIIEANSSSSLEFDILYRLTRVFL